MKTTQLGAALNSLCILTKLIFRAISGFVLLCLALWIQRLARFLDKTEPGPLFVFIIGCAVGFVMGCLGDVTTLRAPLYQWIWTGIVICFKFGLTALLLLYCLWEVFQSFKWLFKWSKQYQRQNAGLLSKTFGW